jgi:membrane-bound lytic murein transglycosylase D
MFGLRRDRLLLIFAACWFAVPASAQTAFPAEGLESRIDFWRKVFTKYGAEDVIVHDRFHVNLIYAVATDATAKDIVRRVKDDLREIGDGLSTPEALSETASSTLEAILGAGLEPSRPLLEALLDGVHTQRGVTERFRGGIIRSGRYLESFQRIMEDNDVPAELALLPLVESSYENARSVAAAVGVWQFTRPTSRGYLIVRRSVDERLDPVKSARAAAKLLKSHYDVLGSWPLAITAYNHGRGGMLRAKAEHGADLPAIIDQYRSPLFGYASMNFYTEFLAAIDVYEHRQDYFGALALERPVARPAVAKAAASDNAAGTGRSDKAAATENPTPARPASYTVRRGDTLSNIARRFGTSIQNLMSWNKLAGHSIYAGQILVVR